MTVFTFTTRRSASPSYTTSVDVARWPPPCRSVAVTAAVASDVEAGHRPAVRQPERTCQRPGEAPSGSSVGGALTRLHTVVCLLRAPGTALSPPGRLNWPARTGFACSHCLRVSTDIQEGQVTG